MGLIEKTLPQRHGDVLFEVTNRIGMITLNRPQALNALSHGMVLSIEDTLRAWADDPYVVAVLIRGAGGKAFCAGGDVRALYDSYRNAHALHRDFFVDEYRLDCLTYRYPKPYIALLDGIVMGGGMGLAQGAALRIVTERSKLAMPETGIGLFPDVGASYFLARMQVELALYLGLTGKTIGAADALYCGLADIYLPSGAVPQLLQALAEIRWEAHGDALAAIRAAAFALGEPSLVDPPLGHAHSAIHRHFRAPDVAAIMASLAWESDAVWRDWAKDVLALMHTRSPLMMAVTHRQLLAGRHLDLADCFRMELGLVYQVFEHGDFIEGVRALLVDKDKRPRWRHAAIDCVSPSDIARHFIPPWPAREHPLAALSSAQPGD